MNRIVLILLIQLFVLGISQAQNLLFKSGFESGVKIDAPIVNNGQWFQTISGLDETTGFEWPLDFPTQDSLDAFWTYKVPDTEKLSDYIEVNIDRITGHKGDSTNTLFMLIRDYSGDNFNGSMQGHVRTEYRLNMDTTLSQAYISYWMKVQPNLYDIMRFGKGGWRMIMEWFESGETHSDYRWNLTMRTNKPDADSSFAFWRMATEFQNGPGNPGDFLADSIVNEPGLVPAEEWFKVEVLWRQAPDSTGRLWVAIDGKTLVDKRGSNMRDSYIQNWQIFKLYTDTLSMNVGDVYQWIDDVEIWDDFPGETTSSEQDEAEVPDTFALFQNYPNPFNPSTTIMFELPKAGFVTLDVFNINGRKVVALVDQVLSAGKHKITFDASNISSGVYLYRFHTTDITEIRKMVLIK